MLPLLMTDAEVHDFGVEVVFGFLKKEGHEIVAVNTELGRDPQIVCKLDDQLEFIVVRTAAFPGKGLLPEPDKARCLAHAEKSGALCYFASVGIANAEAKTEQEMSILVKGAGYHVSFRGIELMHNLQ